MASQHNNQSDNQHDNQSDVVFMQRALRLARQGLGQVAPNPSVGCVIIRNGCVLGEARTQNGGRPHAETQAIEMAQNNPDISLADATAYVTLEPCVHQGATGSCAQALIDSGVSRVVVAMHDPDKRCNGQGIEQLKDAGIHVVTGICEQEAAQLNAGFVLCRTQKRPLVTLKIAVSQNGMMRVSEGKKSVITSEQAQRRMHLIRAEHDAILVGIGTFLADSPALTCRLPGMQDYSPKPYVATRQKTFDEKLHNMQAWTVLSQQHPSDMLEHLCEIGITRLMLEGGATLARAFLEADLIDQIFVFTAPVDLPLIEDKQNDVQFMGIENLPHSDKFILKTDEACLPDMLYHYVRRS